MAIDMEDVGGVLLGTRRDQEIRKRDPVVAEGGELPVRPEGDGDGLAVYAEVSECSELPFDRFVLGR